MARYEVPRPKKSEYTMSVGFLGGKRVTNYSAYNAAVARWEADKEEFYSNQRSQRSGGSRRGGGAGRVAKGVVSAGIALHGASAQPQQNSDSTQKNWVQGAGMQEEARQGRQARGGTRDKGRGSSGSSTRG